MSRLVVASLLGLVLATGAGAQGDPAFDPSRRPAARKSPVAAHVIGIIPGAGHVYAGEAQRGLQFFGGTVGVLAVGTMLVASDCAGDGPDGDCASPLLENVVVGAALGVWGWSIYDAGQAARRTNARRGLRSSLLLAPGRVAVAPRDERLVLRVGVAVGR